MIGLLFSISALFLTACSPSTSNPTSTALPVLETPQEGGYPGQNSPAARQMEKLTLGRAAHQFRNEEAIRETLPVPTPTLSAGGYPPSGLDEFKEPRFSI